MNGIVKQPQISGDWHGVTVEERAYNYVDFKLNFQSNGEITGSGVDPYMGQGPRAVELFGYSYLNAVVIMATAQDDTQTYMFAGNADSEFDEIYGRWWLLDD